ncbi:hypothetical protein BH10ACI3_BH10ACI3_15710 [soil metagenome]
MSNICSVFKGGLFVALAAIMLSSAATAQKVRLRSEITPNCTSSAGANLKFADIFADGNIAVQGSYGCRGAFIYDITNPDAPVLASWYNPGGNQQFLEAIIVGNRGYFGSGTGSGGVHIVDLTNPYSPVLLGTVDSTHGNAHNLIHEMVVFNQGGQTYLLENYNSLSTTKILKIINVTNPAAPVFVRDLTPTEPQWVHAMVVKGNRLFTSGWGNSANRGRTEIYDISNIATTAPVLLGFISDQSSITAGNSMHSAWPSEDGNYLYSCRETSNGSGDVRVYNITNPAVPVLVNSIGMNALGLNAVTPHNPVVAGNYLYVAWYQAGIQVFDLTNPADPKRVGQYDTFQPTFAPPAEEKKALLDAEPWDMVCGSEYAQNSLPTTYDGNWAVYPFLGQNKILAGDLQYGLLVLDASAVTAPLKNVVSDFDGDGRTDLSVFKPSSGDWQIELSSTGATNTPNFGLSTDILASGDYNGDGRTELAIFRPSNGTWWFRQSDGVYNVFQFGQAGDIPVPGDYDADGKTDIAVWRPSNGLWFIQQSTLGLRITQWGLSSDKPVVGDFEGDGKADIAVWRPSNGVWYVLQSSSSIPLYMNFGSNGDRPVAADFDGNGKTDFAVYRPSTGTWYILDPAVGPFRAFNFGLATDTPIPADYDGDGKTDIAVFRPADDNWYTINSSTGSISVRNFGRTGDVPSPGSVQPQ